MVSLAPDSWSITRAVTLFSKAHKLRAVAPRHVWKRAGEPRQHRVEEILRTALPLLRALQRRLLLPRRRERLAAEFVAVGEARHPGIVLAVVAVIAGRLDPRHDEPAPEEFHGADMDHVHPRLGDAAIGLFDQHAGDAAPAEIARHREPHRT